MFDGLRERFHYGRYAKVKDVIDKPGRLLDIGCGRPCDSMEDGAFIKYLGNKRNSVGMDLKPCLGFPFVRGDIKNIPFLDNSFDIVVAMEIFVIIDNVELALQNIHRVLKDEGVLILTNLNNSFIFRIGWDIWRKTVGRLWKDYPLNFYTKKEWFDLFEGYFEIISTQDYLGITIIKLRNARRK